MRMMLIKIGVLQVQSKRLSAKMERWYYTKCYLHQEQKKF